MTSVLFCLKTKGRQGEGDHGEGSWEGPPMEILIQEEEPMKNMESD